ncbi:alanyl-tRNA editing protein AlaX [Sulfolobales archaeon HS-7]|nr:alanyl-tRNA editing protein AlaX [Sulfolobales archaeon HS-7]
MLNFKHFSRKAFVLRQQSHNLIMSDSYPLYMFDSYLNSFKSEVIEVVNDKIYLKETAFFPGGGGLENDIGFIEYNNRQIPVVKVEKEGKRIAHYIGESEIPKGVIVNCTIAWDRRYKMMRLHTASHIIAAIAYNEFGAMVTGGHISPEYAKDDFSLDSKEHLEAIVEKANEVALRGIDVKVYFLNKDEAIKIPGIVKLAERNPPDEEKWRIVEIPGIDIQADGGPHVKNTKEIGKIRITKIENKGKNRKRVYYTVE